MFVSRYCHCCCFVFGAVIVIVVVIDIDIDIALLTSVIIILVVYCRYRTNIDMTEFLMIVIILLIKTLLPLLFPGTTSIYFNFDIDVLRRTGQVVEVVQLKYQRGRVTADGLHNSKQRLWSRYTGVKKWGR